MNELYPLKFHPIFKDKIWGGDKIRTQLGLDFSPLPNCGEAWVLSGVSGSETAVSEGWLKGNQLNELVEIYMDELVGEKVFEKHGSEFPLLIKLLDANDWLSIQVHPDDDLAKKRHNGSGKTEMWYILQADPDSKLISGFNQEMNKDKYLEHLKNNTLPEIMNFEPVQAGNVFYMPSGRVHALGPGIVLAEIQQTSDLTYRIYDWDRVDAGGKSRELHSDLALDAIDFKRYNDYWIQPITHKDQASQLVQGKYFTTNLLQLSKPMLRDYSGSDTFVIYLCTEGSASVDYHNGVVHLRKGECLLLPAMFDKVVLNPKTGVNIIEILPFGE